MGPIVDSHVHLLPLALGRAIRAFFTDHGRDPDTFVYPLDHDVVCDRLAADGVAQAWSLPYVRRPGAATALNQAMADIARAQRTGPLEVIAGCTVHPGDEDGAAIVRAAVEDLGARVLKLHCSVGDFAPDDRRLDPVWEYASRVALPVVVHAGHAHTGHTTAAELQPIARVARRFPDARIIIAHCGHQASAAALDLVEAHPSVFADLTPVVDDPVQIPAGRAPAVAPKLLLGTDAPNTAFTVPEVLTALDGLGLSGPQRDLITGGTARRLMAEVSP